jgi:DNA-binding CsgD family transcriptional regulator
LVILASIDLWVLEDYVEGKQIAIEAFDLATQQGHPMGIACSCWFLGQLALQEGRPGDAKRFQMEALRIWTDLGGEHNRRTSHRYLGDIALQEGKYAEARQWYYDGLAVKTDLLQQTIGAPSVLASIARLLVAEGAIELAAELSAFLLKHRNSATFNPQRTAVQVLDELKGKLSAAIFAAAVERGTARNLQDILQELLTYLDTPLEEGTRQPETPAKLASNFLTEREQEVLGWMAQGMSNPQIARQLTLAVGTVKWYVSQICSKLHAENRVQALNRARELNLLS